MQKKIFAKCLILKNSRILLIKKSGQEAWALPGGAVEENQEPESVAIELTKAQTNLDVKIIQLFEMYESQRDGEEIEDHVFETHTETEDITAGKGIEETKFFTLGEAKKLKVSDNLKLVLEEL